MIITLTIRFFTETSTNFVVVDPFFKDLESSFKYYREIRIRDAHTKGVLSQRAAWLSWNDIHINRDKEVNL